MSDELSTVIGKRIVGWDATPDGYDEDLDITLILDDGRRLLFGAAERCGDSPVVFYYIKEPVAVNPAKICRDCYGGTRFLTVNGQAAKCDRCGREP